MKPSSSSRVAIIGGLVLLLTACVTVPQGTSLNDPAPAAQTRQQSIWIKPVSIARTQARVKDIPATEEGLTLAINNYINSSHQFAASNTLPGKVLQGDHVLAFSFDHYKMERHPHPAYFPVAILTATLYIWFNGPIYTDKIDIEGNLAVYDSSERLLTTFHSREHANQNVGFWSPNYIMPDGATPRTTVVADLLAQYQNFLNQQKGITP